MKTTNYGYLFAATAAFLVGCPKPLSDISDPKKVRALCADWGGVPLVIPDSRYKPGALFLLRKDKPPSLLNTNEILGVCGIPNDLVDPKNAQSSPVSLSSTASAEYKASAVLSFNPGITAGPDWDKVSKVTLDMNSVNAASMQIAELNVYLGEHRQTFSEACKTELKKPDYYFVGEALVVANTTFTLEDSNSAKLGVTAANVGKFVKFDPSVSYTVTEKGEIKIPDASTVCVHQAVLDPNTLAFGTLGGPGPERTPGPGDQQLLDVYNKTTGAK